MSTTALPDMAKGIARFWSIRRREAPDELMGLSACTMWKITTAGFGWRRSFRKGIYARSQHCGNGLLV